jgi:hypothetical protein
MLSRTFVSRQPRGMSIKDACDELIALRAVVRWMLGCAAIVTSNQNLGTAWRNERTGYSSWDTFGEELELRFDGSPHE